MSDENIPTAQGTDNAAELQNNSNPANGAESRIGELTAKFRDMERTVADKDAQIAALIQAQLAAQTQHSQSTNTNQPAVEIDPEEQRKYDAYFTPRMKALEAMVGRLETAQVSQQFQQFQNQVPPEVLKRAQDLQLSWTRSGKQGWVPQDALTYAYGEHAAKQNTAGQARNEQNRFNQGSGNVNMQTSPAPVSAPLNGLPKNIDDLPIHERLALREKALANIPWED